MWMWGCVHIRKFTAQIMNSGGDGLAFRKSKRTRRKKTTQWGVGRGSKVMHLIGLFTVFKKSKHVLSSCCLNKNNTMTTTPAQTVWYVRHMIKGLDNGQESNGRDRWNVISRMKCGVEVELKGNCAIHAVVHEKKALRDQNSISLTHLHWALII